jgi:hypothetical protein
MLFLLARYYTSGAQPLPKYEAIGPMHWRRPFRTRYPSETLHDRVYSDDRSTGSVSALSTSSMLPVTRSSSSLVFLFGLASGSRSGAKYVSRLGLLGSSTDKGLCRACVVLSFARLYHRQMLYIRGHGHTSAIIIITISSTV